jgi:hypothetical protein
VRTEYAGAGAGSDRTRMEKRVNQRTHYCDSNGRGLLPSVSEVTE